jgi:hypothetical protein
MIDKEDVYIYFDNIKRIAIFISFLMFTVFVGSLLGIVWWFTWVFFKFTFKLIQHGFCFKAITTLFTYYLERPEVAENIISTCIGGVIVMQYFTLFAIQLAWKGFNPFHVFSKLFIREGKMPGE